MGNNTTGTRITLKAPTDPTNGAIVLDGDVRINTGKLLELYNKPAGTYTSYIYQDFVTNLADLIIQANGNLATSGDGRIV